MSKVPQNPTTQIIPTLLSLAFLYTNTNHRRWLHSMYEAVFRECIKRNTHDINSFCHMGMRFRCEYDHGEMMLVNK